jgi:hydrogenase maturation factor
MCQAPLGKVISVGDGTVTVKYKGRMIILSAGPVKAGKGDYVFFSGNMVIEQVDREDAKLLGAGD